MDNGVPARSMERAVTLALPVYGCLSVIIDSGPIVQILDYRMFGVHMFVFGFLFLINAAFRLLHHTILIIKAIDTVIDVLD